MPAKVLDIFRERLQLCNPFPQMERERERERAGEWGRHCLRPLLSQPLNTKAYKQIKQKIKALSARQCMCICGWENLKTRVKAKEKNP